MKKSFYLIGLFLIIQLSSSAQDDKNRSNELGVSISGSTFGLRFKSGIEKTLLRLTLLSTSGAFSKQKAPNDSESKSNNLGLGFNVGFEKRKSVSENFYLYYGSDILNSFDRDKYENESNASLNKHKTYSLGLGFILGFHYKINSKLNISSEIIPSIIYSNEKYFSDQDGIIYESSNSGLNYGLNYNSINLTLSFNIK